MNDDLPEPELGTYSRTDPVPYETVLNRSPLRDNASVREFCH